MGAWIFSFQAGMVTEAGFAHSHFSAQSQVWSRSAPFIFKNVWFFPHTPVEARIQNILRQLLWQKWTKLSLLLEDIMVAFFAPLLVNICILLACKDLFVHQDWLVLLEGFAVHYSVEQPKEPNTVSLFVSLPVILSSPPVFAFLPPASFLSFPSLYPQNQGLLGHF